MYLYELFCAMNKKKLEGSAAVLFLAGGGSVVDVVRPL